MLLGQRVRGFEDIFPLIKLKLHNTPGGKNAKRNYPSLAALVGGTLLSIQQNKEREARLWRPYMVLGPAAAVLYLRAQLLRAMVFGEL